MGSLISFSVVIGLEQAKITQFYLLTTKFPTNCSPGLRHISLRYWIPFKLYLYIKIVNARIKQKYAALPS